MRATLAIALLAACLGTNALAAMTTLSGTVTNGTTGKPAAGDEVVLISLANGMTETGRVRSDARGRFSFTISDAHEPRLVRVLHQGVSYHTRANGVGTSVTVQVFNVANKLDGVSMAVDVQRFQAEGDTLQVIEQFAVRNASQPPQTLMNDHAFEIQLPSEAHVDSAMVQSGSGQPVTQTLVPGDRKDRYYFRFPLRPGETRFQVIYRLAYKGEVIIEPKFFYPLERLVVVLPRSMKFEPAAAGIFRPSSSRTGDTVQTTAPLKIGQSSAFHLSGAGTLAEVQESLQKAPGSEKPRPGGGLGLPTGSPDPLHNYRGLILVGLATVLAAGGVYTIRPLRAAKRERQPDQQPRRGRAKRGSSSSPPRQRSCRRQHTFADCSEHNQARLRK